MWGGSSHLLPGLLVGCLAAWLLVAVGRCECTGGGSADIQAEMASEQRSGEGCLKLCGGVTDGRGLAWKQESRRLSGRYSETFRARGEQACAFWPLEGN